MGIDFTGCECIFKSLKYVKNKKELLTLGRQGIHIPPYTVDYFLEKNNFNHLKIRARNVKRHHLLKDDASIF